MKINELIELDKKLREIGISGVYGSWGGFPYFSIGEGSDNKNVYPGYIVKTESNCKPVIIKGSSEENKSFMITHIKNDKNRGKYLEYSTISKFLQL